MTGFISEFQDKENDASGSRNNCSYGFIAIAGFLSNADRRLSSISRAE
jgi:hypothetical protein